MNVPWIMPVSRDIRRLTENDSVHTSYTRISFHYEYARADIMMWGKYGSDLMKLNLMSKRA